ncbi:hypothetical protein RND71_017038 [Anisodus tanguticus]|uniref:Methyltransferase-like protein n=1 Tax=Anisodus tanguticus TaxID=243964 RepID=A0AAE1S216_9SOLA|nr:hypothetical protein RND71_017038 [Anisodus tanguticus]
MHAVVAPPVMAFPTKWPVNSAPRVGRRYLTIRCWTSLFNDIANHHYSRRSQQYWDKFYKLHKNKDQHYLEKDWRSHFDDEIESSYGKVVLGDFTIVVYVSYRSSYLKSLSQVGCGAGNTIFPLIDTFPKIYVHAYDFSPKAINLVKICVNLLISCYHQE